MKLFRFRLSTLLLLTACTAAGLATLSRRSAWYLSKSIPSGFQSKLELVAIEEQDLLVCLKTSISERMVVRKLSTGKVLQDFDDPPDDVDHLLAVQKGQLYGFGSYRVVRIDPATGKSIELMTGSDGPPESLIIKAVSPNGQSVLIAVQNVVELPNGRSIIRPSTPITYRVYDLVSGKLQWERPSTDTRFLGGTFFPDGKRIGIACGNHFEIWDFGKNIQINGDHRWVPRMFTRSYAVFPDGRRVLSPNSIQDLHSGMELMSFGGVGIGLSYAIVNDSFFINSRDGQLHYWRRRRVEGSWSPFEFPEVWITGVLAIASVFNVIFHARRQQKRD